MRKVLDQFDEYDSHSLRYIKQVSGKRKDHRLEKYKSNLDISEVLALWNLRTGPMKRLNGCARSWNLAKTCTSSKRRTRLHSTRPRRECVLPAASTKEPDERKCVVDSGASVHVVSEKDLDSAESETMRTSRSPTTVMTPNGEVQTREEATVYVKQSDLFVKVMLLEETRAVLS